MRLSTTPINLNKRMNKKSRKTNRSISDENVKERTSLNENGMYMRNRPNVVTRNPNLVSKQVSSCVRSLDLRVNP